MELPPYSDMDCPSSMSTRCAPGIFLPRWEPADNISYGDRIGRSIVYLLCLLYMFLGVSIIADKFMTSIEVITSKEKQVVIKRKDGIRQVIRVRIWNETVSNLTLMALGSSAPEILLSVIEIVGKGFQAGELGPSTIVGSAAFNLFVILGICVVVIPDGQCRRIHHRSVFFITATWSIFAYLWLYLIIAVISPNVVEIWEAVLTFLFFPATVISAYIADTKIFFKRFLPSRLRSVVRFSRREGAAAEDGQADLSFKGLDDDNPAIRQFERHRKEYIETLRAIRKQHASLEPRELEKMAQMELLSRGPKSRAYYRMEATRRMMGSGSVIRKARVEQINQDLEEQHPEWHGDAENRVFFDPAHYTVMENVGSFNIVVRRESSNPELPILVDYKTADGTAIAGEDYEAAEGTITFKAHEMLKEVILKIIDDVLFEEDEHFYVQLSNARIGDEAAQKKPEMAVEIANPSMATIMVLDDDHCGVFHFGVKTFEVSEACGTASVSVFRSSGSRGLVRVPFETVDGTAKGHGDDYESKKGYLDFPNDVIEQEIEVRIIDDEDYEKNESFFIQLGEPFLVDGDSDDNLEKKSTEDADSSKKNANVPRLGQFHKLEVRIIESTEFKNSIDKLLKKANLSLMVGTSSWKEQFVDAISMNTGDGDSLEEGERRKPSICDYVVHFLTIFWKVLFACLPPTDYLGGWLAFCCSIIVIGFMTALIGDFASHFGCSAGLTESVTAITFVALGTSVPDTFASKTAAVGDKYADSSIGNVNGSNAVNVFLGIGLAWSIAAIYHASQGSQFYVQAGSLGFSVTIFCIMAVVCIVVLSVRRHSFFGGELGGKKAPKIFTGVFFFVLWLLYVILASLENYCHIKGF